MASGRFEVDPLMRTCEKVHCIPVKIDANQVANVQAKFVDRITKDDNGAMEVHLRGRPLHGSNVTLPPNFRGFETTVANNHLKDEVPKVHKLISEFSEFTYWNWDKNPSPMDSHVKLLDWLSASEILHAPVCGT